LSGTLLSCSTTLCKSTAPQSHALRVCPPLPSARAVKCSAVARVIPRTHMRPRSPDDALKARRSIAQHATRPSLVASRFSVVLLFSKPHSGAVCLLITKPNTTPVLLWPPTTPLNRVSAATHEATDVFRVSHMRNTVGKTQRRGRHSFQFKAGVYYKCGPEQGSVISKIWFRRICTR
jgi:hypothetical protein